jgi:hypothetical protein
MVDKTVERDVRPHALCSLRYVQRGIELFPRHEQPARSFQNTHSLERQAEIERLR